jgi:hypothetical protein
MQGGKVAKTYSVREAANIMGCSINNVLTLLWRADRLPGAVKVGGRWAIPDSALRVYMRQRDTRRGQAITSNSGGNEFKPVSDSAVTATA